MPSRRPALLCSSIVELFLPCAWRLTIRSYFDRLPCRSNFECVPGGVARPPILPADTAVRREVENTNGCHLAPVKTVLDLSLLPSSHNDGEIDLTPACSCAVPFPVLCSLPTPQFAWARRPGHWVVLADHPEARSELPSSMRRSGRLRQAANSLTRHRSNDLTTLMSPFTDDAAARTSARMAFRRSGSRHSSARRVAIPM